LYWQKNKGDNVKVEKEVGWVYTVKNPFSNNTEPTIDEEITWTIKEVNTQLLQDAMKSLWFYFLEILTLKDIRKAVDNITFSIIYKLENVDIKNFSLKDRVKEDIKKIKLGDKTAILDLFSALNDNTALLKQIWLLDPTETKFEFSYLENPDKNEWFRNYLKKYNIVVR